MIHKFKFANGLYFTTFFALLICQIINSLNLNLQKSIIVPIAMDKYRLRKRTYNQAALLAQKVAKITDCHCIVDFFIKIKNSRKQSSLNYYERQQNLLNSLIVNKKYHYYLQSLLNKQSQINIIIIDDIITTGATMNSAIQALENFFISINHFNYQDLKKTKVYCLAIAYTPNFKE